MDSSPARVYAETAEPASQDQENDGSSQTTKMKKPPPITPRRFTRFFTPRPRNTSATVRTSRAALRAISGSALNTRSGKGKEPKLPQSSNEDKTPHGRKRKLDFVLADDSVQSSPISQVGFLCSSQEIRSSPTIPERRSPTTYSYHDVEMCDTEDETDIEEEEEEGSNPQGRIAPYGSRTTAGSLLSARLTGKKGRQEIGNGALWQQETGNFYSLPNDINNTFSRPSAALPFSVAACHTNPIVAVGDEEGRVRLLDTSDEYQPGLTQNWVTMRPHDNAIMDLEFSLDDRLLATACGDQSCQIVDVYTQTSLYTLGDHRCSVKKIAFQPDSNNQILASCGRDGQINFWDLRCNNTPQISLASRKPTMPLPMTDSMKQVHSTHSIRDAHVAGPKAKLTSQRRKLNMVPGRNDFSITSLSFLGKSKPHLLATASEIDTGIKIWDIRTSFGTSRRAPNPLSVTEEPRSHAHHRSFGVTSIVLNTDESRLYALSRDHTVYAYATSHLVLGSSIQMSSNSKASRPSDHHEGLGPLYGFRHPSMRIQTFWPRLAIRKATDANTELLAVGSSDDCAVLFPTHERYLTKAVTRTPSLHMPSTDQSRGKNADRPPLSRSNSSFTDRLLSSGAQDESLPIYQHGTPLIRGHDKEVTSLAWASGGSLITASDDYTVRCWRENANQARHLRTSGEKNGIRWKSGWSSVGFESFDEDEEY